MKKIKNQARYEIFRQKPSTLTLKGLMATGDLPTEILSDTKNIQRIL